MITRVEAAFPPKEWIRAGSVSIYPLGTERNAALDNIEKAYGRPLRDYLQSLCMKEGQELCSAESLMPPFKRLYPYDPSRYALRDSIYRLVVREKGGKIKIWLQENKMWRPRSVQVAEINYETVKA